MSYTVSHISVIGSLKIHGYLPHISMFGGGEIISEEKGCFCYGEITQCIRFLCSCDKEHTLLCVEFLCFDLSCKQNYLQSWKGSVCKLKSLQNGSNLHDLSLN